MTARFDRLRLADEAEIDHPLDVGIGIDFAVRVTCSAKTMLPSLPERPTALPPSALIAMTISLLIEPASTISTTSTVALVGDAEAAAELRLDAELLEHLADLRPAAMHHDRPTPEVSRSVMSRAKALASSGSPMAWPPYFTTTILPS